MVCGKVFFNKVKEDRGWYFVEYSPPIDACRFAMLAIVVPGLVEKGKVVSALEAEVRAWLLRYPVPIMASAFDGKDDLIDLKPSKDCNHLMGYLRKNSSDASMNWRILEDAELPPDALDRDYLKRLYVGIPFKTESDIKSQIQKDRRVIRTAWWIIFIWAVVVPAIVLILGETSVWVSRIVLVYGFSKVVIEVLKLTGHWKKSQAQLKREREEQEKEHHHYHCVRNPKGFLRLKAENFERESIERVKAEAESLKSPKRKTSEKSC